MDLPRRAWNDARAAKLYEQVRPRYPEAALKFLTTALGIGSGSIVVDVGAGTGKLTRQLISTGATLLAVEPLAEMRRQFSAVLPQIPILSGAAESLPLKDQSVSALVSGQAWHWFDAKRAGVEAARVLMASGGVGLLWNEQDESVPWVADLARIRAGAAENTPSEKSQEWRASFDASQGWAPIECQKFRHVQRLSPNGLVQRVLTSSVFAVKTPAEQQAVAVEILSILNRYVETRDRDEVELPYVTEAYWTLRL